MVGLDPTIQSAIREEELDHPIKSDDDSTGFSPVPLKLANVPSRP